MEHQSAAMVIQVRTAPSPISILDASSISMGHPSGICSPPTMVTQGKYRKQQGKAALAQLGRELRTKTTETIGTVPVVYYP